jgi:hypothetical protein
MLKTLAAGAALALVATAAHAGTFRFNIGFTSQGAQPFAVGVATLTTSDTMNADGGYDVTGISGTVSTPGSYGFSAISGLASSFTYPDGSSFGDNEVYPTEPRFDNDGLVFTSASGYIFDLYSVGGSGGGAPELFTSAAAADVTYYLDYQPVGNTDPMMQGESQVTVAVTQIPTSAAPEPGVWALMMAGVGLAGAALRRRRGATLAAA